MGFDHVERVRRVKWEVLSFGSVDIGNGRGKKKDFGAPLRCWV